MIRRQILPAIVMLLAFTVLTGIVYPLVVTGLAQSLFEDEANGSLIERDGEVVGSQLLGQTFVRAEYLHPRPSAAGEGYDGSSSSGSNLGPTNPEFLTLVEARVTAYREQNDLAPDADVPVDAVTASASGLDPHISVANARLQALRVAAARAIDVAVVLQLIDENTDERVLGFLGEPGVNVLAVNLALDDRTR